MYQIMDKNQTFKEMRSLKKRCKSSVYDKLIELECNI